MSAEGTSALVAFVHRHRGCGGLYIVAAPSDNLRVRARRVAVVSAAGAGMLGTFLPWGSLGGFAQIEGTFGDGWISLGLFAIALLTAVGGNRSEDLSRWRSYGTEVVALLAGLVAVYDGSGLHDIGISIGPGVYLVALAALVVVVAASMNSIGCTVFGSFVAALTVVAGAVHVPVGKGVSLQVCKKHGWSLRETFPDVEDYIGTGLSGCDAKDAMSECKVTKALVACGVLVQSSGEQPSQAPEPAENPSTPTIDPSFLGRPCEVPNAGEVGHTASGTCTVLSACVTPSVYYQGFCQGPSAVVCCTPPASARTEWATPQRGRGDRQRTSPEPAAAGPAGSGSPDCTMKVADPNSAACRAEYCAHHADDVRCEAE